MNRLERRRLMKNPEYLKEKGYNKNVSTPRESFREDSLNCLEYNEDNIKNYICGQMENPLNLSYIQCVIGNNFPLKHFVIYANSYLSKNPPGGYFQTKGQGIKYINDKNKICWDYQVFPNFFKLILYAKTLGISLEKEEFSFENLAELVKEKQKEFLESK